MRSRCNREFKGRYPAPRWLGKLTKSQGGQTREQYESGNAVSRATIARHWEAFYRALR